MWHVLWKQWQWRQHPYPHGGVPMRPPPLHHPLDAGPNFWKVVFTTLATVTLQVCAPCSGGCDAIHMQSMELKGWLSRWFPHFPWCCWHHKQPSCCAWGECPLQWQVLQNSLAAATYGLEWREGQPHKNHREILQWAGNSGAGNGERGHWDPIPVVTSCQCTPACISPSNFWKNVLERSFTLHGQ